MNTGRFFLGVAAFAALAFGQEDYSQWTHHKDFALNTAASGANVARNVLNFPVLIRLTTVDSAVFQQSLAGGADTRFARASNAHMPYQIERWDAVNRMAEIWVRVDTVFGNNNSQVLRLYWGRATAADSSRGTAVFDSANGFIGAWHLGDASGTTPRPNAVAGGNPATPNNALAPIPGVVGLADTLRGNGRGQGTLGDHLNLGPGYADFGNSTATISMWVKPASFGSANFVQFIDIGNTNGGNGNNAIWFGRLGSSSLTLSSQVVNATTNANRLDATDGTIALGQWQYVTFTVNGTNDSLYWNGGLVASQSTGQMILNTARTAAYIGRSAWTGDSTLKGVVDEVTVSKTTRSADWVRLSYENQKPNQTLVAIPNGLEDYSTWGHHKNVILNTASAGANVQGAVLNFPVLIRLSASNADIFSQSAVNGSDIRFTKANGVTRLPHQIESWDNANKTAAIWVRVDTVKGNVNNQSIRMHWGRSGAPDSSNGKVVFDTARGFQAVWHMDGLNATSDEPDATANNFSALQNGSPAPSAGMIGGARNFDGASGFFAVPNTASGPLNFAQNGNYTVSAWVNTSSFSAHGVVVSKHDKQYALKLNNSSAWEFFEFEDQSGWNAVSYPPPDAAGTWEHLAGVWEGTNAYLYVNGMRVSNSPGLTTSATARISTTDVTLGRQNESQNRYFSGMMDEVRMASVSRDSNWMRLEYQNQQAAQTLVSLSDTIPSHIVYPAFVQAGLDLSFSPLNRGLLFKIQTRDAERIRLTLMDIWGRTVWTHEGTVAGASQVIWDGQSRSGRAGSGVYVLRITRHNVRTARDQEISRKILLP